MDIAKFLGAAFAAAIALGAIALVRHLFRTASFAATGALTPRQVDSTVPGIGSGRSLFVPNVMEEPPTTEFLLANDGTCSVHNRPLEGFSVFTIVDPPNNNNLANPQVHHRPIGTVFVAACNDCGREAQELHNRVSSWEHSNALELPAWAVESVAPHLVRDLSAEVEVPFNRTVPISTPDATSRSSQSIPGHLVVPANDFEEYNTGKACVFHPPQTHIGFATLYAFRPGHYLPGGKSKPSKPSTWISIFIPVCPTCVAELERFKDFIWYGFNTDEHPKWGRSIIQSQLKGKLHVRISTSCTPLKDIGLLNSVLDELRIADGELKAKHLGCLAWIVSMSVITCIWWLASSFFLPNAVGTSWFLPLFAILILATIAFVVIKNRREGPVFAKHKPVLLKCLSQVQTKRERIFESINCHVDFTHVYSWFTNDKDVIATVPSDLTS